VNLRVKLSALLPAALILFGCSASKTIQFSPHDRAEIKTISIDQNVVKPQEVYYHGPVQSWGGAFGAIGIAVGQSDAKDTKSLLLEFFDREHIDIATIFADEFNKQLSESGHFTSIVPQGGNATLKIEILLYGFGQSNGLSSKLYPLISANAKLVKPDGTIIWQKSEYVTPLNSDNSQGYKLEEYTNDPQKLRTAFSTASKIVIKMFLSNMQGKS